MRNFIFLTLAIVTGCNAGPGAPPPSAAFSDTAIAFLDEIQPASIAVDRELCGYFGLDAAGAFVVTDPVEGGKSFCDLPAPPENVTIVASYHTHSAFTPEYDSEVPSPGDIRTDARDRIYGYISTPGGRIWLVNWQDRSARQLCGIGCVYQDPGFVPLDAGPIAEFYTIEELRNR